MYFYSCEGDKYAKAKEWKVPTVSIQWLNDVFFGSMNAVQCMNNPKYQNFRSEDPFKIDYSLVPNLMASWKNPIRITPVRFHPIFIWRIFSQFSKIFLGDFQ